MSKNKKQIGKVAPIPEQIKKMLIEHGYGELNIGDLFINSTGGIYRIAQWEYNKNRSEGYRELVHIEFAKDEELTKWSKKQEQYLSDFLEDFVKGNDFKLPADYKKLNEKALNILDGKDTDKELIENDYKDLEGSNEYAIMGRTTKDGLIAITNALQEKRNKAGVVKSFMEKEIQKRMNALARLKDGLYEAVEVFQKQINKLMRIITTIELYLGIGEEMHQIMQGTPADINEPICFRQLVLYIDEEVGVWENGGLDWRDIEKFDEWLVADKHYEKIIPEQKGMVVLKPRRKEKYYGENAGIWGAQMNVQNLNQTYFLIRNGENIYRIFTEKIVIGSRFLPLRNEIAEYQKEIAEIMENDLNDDSWQEREREKVEKKMYRYTNQTLLMQGLIDRTEVFYPLLKPDLKLLTLHELEDSDKYVRFIYDAEMQLPSGRLTYSDWKKELNSKIKHGSRILIALGDGREYRPKNYKDRFFRYYNEHSIPALPPPAVYQVEIYKEQRLRWKSEEQIKELKEKNLLIKQHPQNEIQERSVATGKDDKFGFPEFKEVKTKVWKCEYYKEHLTIMYNPKDEVSFGSGGWGDYDPHERKNRLRFVIHPSDEFIFNYDLITLDEVNFYLESRVDRPNYLRMMPVLKGLRASRIKELKNENDFGRFIFHRHIETFKLTYGMVEGTKELNRRIHEAIAYWKLKNEIKRPIQKDDTLALRMIEQRINSKNYHKLKTLDT